MYGNDVDFSDFVGKVFEKIDVGDKEIVFHAPGFTAKMYHDQSCCESVYVESVDGDISALCGHKIVMAEESTSDAKEEQGRDYGLFMWTFYKLADEAGHYVTIRWSGESNGYYSVSVDIVRL